jgi:hypothetical protein
VAEREVSGDFDYLWDDPADVDGLTSRDQVFEAEPAEELDQPLNDPGDDLWDEPDDNFWDKQPDPDDPGHFDAFNINAWSFRQAPTPWYRTRQAVTAIIAASAAMAAIVVSAVLLVFRDQGGTVTEDVTSSVTPTAPTSAAPTSAAPVQVPSSEAPPPPVQVESSEAPPPPETASPPPETASPPPETALPVNTAPPYNPTYQPRPTKAPEIGVTRTPITRSPISVAPQPRSK